MSYHLNFQSCETPPRVPSMRKFFLLSLPLRCHHPFRHNPLCPCLCLPRVPPVLSAVPNGDPANISTVGCPSRIPFPFSSNFTFHLQCYCFSFLCCIFTSVGQVSLLIIRFSKMAYGFIPGGQGGNPAPAFLSACEQQIGSDR